MAGHVGRSPRGVGRVCRDLRYHASWMRLLVRHGTEICGVPPILGAPPEGVSHDGDATREPSTQALGDSLRMSMDAEELASFTDWVADAVEGSRGARLDLALRMRDLLEVRRPPRKAIIAPVDGIVQLEPSDGYQRLSLRVPYMEDGAFPIVLTLDDRPRVADGEEVVAGTLLSDGEIYLPDLLQIAGARGVIEAFDLHMRRIASGLGEEEPPQLPAALAFVRNWMLGWVRVQDPGSLPLAGGQIVPWVEVEALVRQLGPADAHPRLQGQLIGLPRLAERYLGGVSAEAW